MTAAETTTMTEDSAHVPEHRPRARRFEWERDASVEWMLIIPGALVLTLGLVYWIDSMTR